jgi:hypothetical protein
VIKQKIKNKKNIFIFILNTFNKLYNIIYHLFKQKLINKWGLGIGDWGLGIGDWAWGLGPIPNPQSPIPNPQSPIPIPKLLFNFL